MTDETIAARDFVIDLMRAGAGEDAMRKIAVERNLAFQDVLTDDFISQTVQEWKAGIISEFTPRGQNGWPEADPLVLAVNARTQLERARNNVLDALASLDGMPDSALKHVLHEHAGAIRNRMHAGIIEFNESLSEATDRFLDLNSDHAPEPKDLV